MKDLKLYIESIVDKVISEREIDEMEEFYELHLIMKKHHHFLVVKKRRKKIKKGRGD